MNETTTLDKSLAQDVKDKDCEEALIELINRHTPLCYNIYKKYQPAITASGHCITEISKEKDYWVYKAAKSYDPTRKVKFSTWLGNQIKYHCLNVINDNRYIAVEDKDLDFLINKSPSEETSDFQAEIDFVFNILDQLRDKRIKKVFEERYFSKTVKKKPWSKIAKIVGVSTQTAINLHERGISILKRKMLSKQSPDKI
tara:strand:- start:918 stop:1514 length:597 start_codon:yes stop_codon:yes gene_type:complete